MLCDSFLSKLDVFLGMIGLVDVVDGGGTVRLIALLLQNLKIKNI